jgi:hypothetical protein
MELKTSDFSFVFLALWRKRREKVSFVLKLEKKIKNLFYEKE